MIGSPAAQGLALVSAGSFGVSDFVGGLASRRVAALRVLLVANPIAMVLLGVVAAVAGGSVSAGDVVWGVLGGISQAIGTWWFFAALAIGPIAVVSPLSAVVDAAVPVAVGVVLGERPGPVATAGIGLALVAVVLISWQVTDTGFRPHHFIAEKVAWLAIGSGLALGLNFVFIDQTSAESRLWPLLFARAAASVLVIGLAAASRNLNAPSGVPLRLALLVGVLDTAANITMLLALHLAMLSLASILISLYPVMTVVLAVVVLRERVHRFQLVGMVLALAAVGMITVR